MIDPELLGRVVTFKQWSHFYVVRGIAATNDFSLLLEELVEGEPTGKMTVEFVHAPGLQWLPRYNARGQSWSEYLATVEKVHGTLHAHKRAG